MKHLGDFDAGTIVYGKFSTFQPSTGAAFALAAGKLAVFKDGAAILNTAGVVLQTSVAGLAGLQGFSVDTGADGTAYAGGSFFELALIAGSVDSVSVVGAVVAGFTLRNNSALKPTTAGRTLAVSSSNTVVAVDTALALGAAARADVNAEADTAITDHFTFTVDGMADANIQYVNDEVVGGVGSSGDPWGPT